MPDQLGHREPALVADDRLTVDQARARLQHHYRRHNKRESSGEIMAVAGVKPHARGVPQRIRPERAAELGGEYEGRFRKLPPEICTLSTRQLRSEGSARQESTMFDRWGGTKKPFPPSITALSDLRSKFSSFARSAVAQYLFEPTSRVQRFIRKDETCPLAGPASS